MPNFFKSIFSYVQTKSFKRFNLKKIEADWFSYQFSVRQVNVFDVEERLTETAVFAVDVDVKDEQTKGPFGNADDRNLKSIFKFSSLKYFLKLHLTYILVYKSTLV